jgi:hypothetical protein
MGCEDIWIGPQCKALGPILTIPSSPIGRILDNSAGTHLGPPYKVALSTGCITRRALYTDSLSFVGELALFTSFKLVFISFKLVFTSFKLVVY